MVSYRHKVSKTCQYQAQPQQKTFRYVTWLNTVLTPCIMLMCHGNVTSSGEVRTRGWCVINTLAQSVEHSPPIQRSRLRILQTGLPSFQISREV